ncbi:MAG: DUF3788 family protein [Candidatus Limnocylindrales bacterium]
MVTSPPVEAGAPPSEATLRELLGAADGHWRALTGALEAMGALSTWVWDGPRSGWLLRSTRAGKPFTTLTPGRESFSALVIVGPSLASEVAALPLGDAARRAFETAHPYPDGRWLRLHVASLADVEDVLALLARKLPPRVRARYEATVAGPVGAR